MPRQPVSGAWKRGAPIAVKAVESYIEDHPEAKSAEYGVFVAHAHMAAQMLEKNPSPAMFREFHQAWKALRTALNPDGKKEPSLADLIERGPNEPEE